VGYGFAAHRCFLTYVACVVQVEVQPGGDIAIPRVDYVIDAGTIVNPDRTRSQFEGGAVFGTSTARYGEITAKNGAIEQSNFHDYQLTRFPEAPRKTNVFMVKNDAPPAGVVNPGYRRLCRPSATRFSPQQESASASCRCQNLTSARCASNRHGRRAGTLESVCLMGDSTSL
jgi:Molybdopterin-binding domain of aldehyde dehydrogenase